MADFDLRSFLERIQQEPPEGIKVLEITKSPWEDGGYFVALRADLELQPFRVRRTGTVYVAWNPDMGMLAIYTRAPQTFPRNEASVQFLRLFLDSQPASGWDVESVIEMSQDCVRLACRTRCDLFPGGSEEYAPLVFQGALARLLFDSFFTGYKLAEHIHGVASLDV